MVTTMRSLAILLCAALLALASCTTGVLVADADRGFEGDGDRYLRLRLETVQLDVVEVKPGQFTVPGALCLRDAPRTGKAPCRALQFRLPFLAYNGKDESWPVRLSMFRLERAGAPSNPAGDALVATEGDQTVALLAPHSGAHFDVLVHVAGLGPDDDPLHGDYRLTVQSGPGSGDLLLQKNLSVGSFSQLSQILRFMGMATLLLVGAAAL
jgi:hypothetical protein